jgi:PIN domain nuclease of toxin-antitoxin system
VKLLDTNAALWLVDDPERLGPRTRHLLEAEGDVVGFSAVLAVEVTIKSMTGRIGPAAREVPSALARSGLVELAVTSEHALAMADFPELARHDPFDRLMVSQAYVESATLITSDRRLLALGYDWIVDARS